jgi:hypothetical protein
MLITNNLFEKVLVEPCNEVGRNELFVISGYASSAMASYHLEQLRKNNLDVVINLIIGMIPRDGLSKQDHEVYKNLMDSYRERFYCSYLVDMPPVHSKIYSWKSMRDYRMFVGSANYSQQAFVSHNQKECLFSNNSSEGIDYYQSLVDRTIYCDHIDVDERVALYNARNTRQAEIQLDTNDEKAGVSPSGENLENLEVSLLQANGNMHTASGLNWGQREGREPNQAYIPLVAEVYRSDFFPAIGVHFTVTTDDGKVLVFRRAQDNGKALHTPNNNSLMGEYFRRRLGLANGDFVKKEDLLNYGRTSVRFFKIDEEQFFMDFSV